MKRVTRSEETLLVVGYDWSSELPYYCERRAMMLPGWLPEVQSTSALLSIAMDLETLRSRRLSPRPYKKAHWTPIPTHAMPPESSARGQCADDLIPRRTDAKRSGY